MAKYPFQSPFVEEHSLKYAEKVQHHLHQFVNETMAENKNVSYQDAVNTFFILMLSEQYVLEAIGYAADEYRKSSEEQSEEEIDNQ